jgi:hypothetical protein
MPFWGYLRLLWDHGDRPLLVAVMIGATLAIVRNFKKLSGQFAIVLGATLSYFLFCSAIKPTFRIESLIWMHFYR